MPETLDPLMRHLVEWVDKQPRRYADVMEAWRTSCPKLTVWEDASDIGFVERKPVAGEGVYVFATEAGRSYLRSFG